MKTYNTRFDVLQVGFKVSDNLAAVEIVDKYYKIFITKLSTNITYNPKTKKFSLREYFNIIKKINIELKKELKMLEVKDVKVKNNKKTFEETVVDLAS